MTDKEYNILCKHGTEVINDYLIARTQFFKKNNITLDAYNKYNKCYHVIQSLFNNLNLAYEFINIVNNRFLFYFNGTKEVIDAYKSILNIFLRYNKTFELFDLICLKVAITTNLLKLHF